MRTFPNKNPIGSCKSAFTMVELLVVIAIISMLITAGSMGLSGLGGKGVTSGVATSEGLFEEARAIAVSNGTNARVMILKDPSGTVTDYSASLRRIVVSYQELDTATGLPKPDSWIIAGRGTVLPEQIFFSQEHSKKDHAAGTGAIDEFAPTDWSSNYQGTYFYYEFNSQGICTTPGASFIIGSGTRNVVKSAADQPPRVTASAKRDFGGFVVWRNGRTSVFRNGKQMKTATVDSGDEF